jgi:hypothetical protein
MGREVMAWNFLTRFGICRGFYEFGKESFGLRKRIEIYFLI